MLRWMVFCFTEIPQVIQTQGIAGEDNGEHDYDDGDADERGYDGRAGKFINKEHNIYIRYLML